VLRCCLYVVAVLAGCKDAPGKLDPPAADPVVIRDDAGNVVAELQPTRPCRATIGAAEMIVGGPPLVAPVGSTQWTGSTEPNGTVLHRDGERIARVYPVGDPSSAAVFDLKGIAQARIEVTGQTATVENGASVTVRRLRADGSTITTDDPALTVTGTSDLVLAALLSARELLPEVRMLAACERVLVKGPSQ
jgi:hypothetical protein